MTATAMTATKPTKAFNSRRWTDPAIVLVALILAWQLCHELAGDVVIARDDEQHDSEDEREGDVEDHPQGGLLHRGDVGPADDDQEVGDEDERQHDECDDLEYDGDLEAHESLSEGTTEVESLSPA